MARRSATLRWYRRRTRREPAHVTETETGARSRPLVPADDAEDERITRMELDIPHRVIARVVAWLFGVLVVLWALGNLETVISWVLLATFLAVAADRPVRALEERGARRGLAISGVVLGTVLMVGLVGSALAPPLLQQADGLVRDVPEYVDEIQASDRYQRLDDRFGLRNRIDERLDDATREVAALVPELVRSLVNGVFATAMVLIMSVLMLVHGRGVVARSLDLMPPRSRRRWEPVVTGASSSIGGFVAGTVAVATITGTVSLVMFLALGLPQPLPLTAWVTLWALIPIIGASIGMVPAAIIAYFDEPWKAVALIIAVVIYQQVESAIISPLVLGRSVRVSPLFVLIGVLAGAQLYGVLGAILAVPIVGTVQIVAAEWARHRAEDQLARATYLVEPAGSGDSNSETPAASND